MDENKKEEQLVKMDINFLEYPNWTVAGRSDIKSFTIEKPHGTYHVSTTEKADRLPDRVDKMVLYSLLLSKKKNIKTTRYRIAKAVFGKDAPFYYDKVILALERWMWIGIKFEGTFYEGDGHSKRGFHIIDNYKLIPKDKRGEELTIRINSDFFKQLEETGFFKYLDFEEFKKLRSPVTARMYEILIKTFKDRTIWKIGIMLLAEKLTLNRVHPSQILIKLKSAIKEINKKTNLKFTMDYDPEKQLCTFTLIKSEEKDLFKEGTAEEVRRLLLMLPESLRRQKSVKELVADYHSQKGFQYVYFNILYTLQNANRNKKAYFKKALEENYGEEIQAQMIEAAKIEEERKKQEAKRKEKEEKEIKLWDKVNRWIENHGGKERALYQGFSIVACNPSVGGLVIQNGNERTSIPLDQVKEKEFSSL